MNSRDKILSAINANKLSEVDLPVISFEDLIQYDDVVARFTNTLTGIGGVVVDLDDVQQLRTIIEEEKQTGKYIVNTIAELGEVDNGLTYLTALDLAFVERAYIKGSLGVAENGATWLYETQMINRLLPFICEHLVLVVEKKNILPTMHHAYQKIDISAEGFGVFIAGPSKTADIEQSLVIGAHGARSLVVYLV